MHLRPAGCPTLDLDFRGNLDLESLSGTLRGYPLQAEGKIDFDGDALAIALEELEMKMEELEVTALPDKPVTGEGCSVSRTEPSPSMAGSWAIKTGRLLYSGNPLDNPGGDVPGHGFSVQTETGATQSAEWRRPEI